MTDPRTMADALLAAERERRPIRPFSRRNPFLDAAVGYAAQELLVGTKRGEGKQVVGIKLGMTSKVKRDALGIREPAYGRITADMLVPPGQPLPVAELIHPRAEPELAVVIGRPVPSGADVATVPGAIRSSRAASAPASQATAAAGCPMAAPPAAVSKPPGNPNTQPSTCRSASSDSLRGRSPSTTLAAPALSAIESTSRNGSA